MEEKNIAGKIGYFIGTLFVAVLGVCSVTAIVALTLKLLVWLFG